MLYLRNIGLINKFDINVPLSASILCDSRTERRQLYLRFVIARTVRAIISPSTRTAGKFI